VSFEDIFDAPPEQKVEGETEGPAEETQELVEKSEEEWSPPKVLKGLDGILHGVEGADRVEVVYGPPTVTARMRLLKLFEQDGKWTSVWNYEGKHEFEFDFRQSPSSLRDLGLLKTSRALKLMVGSYFDIDIHISRDGSMVLEGLREIS